MAADGSLYDAAAIGEWLAHHNSSPVTNLALPSHRIISLREITPGVEQLLDACWKRRHDDHDNWMAALLSCAEDDCGSCRPEAALAEVDGCICDVSSEIQHFEQQLRSLRNVRQMLRHRQHQQQRANAQRLAGLVRHRIYCLCACQRQQFAAPASRIEAYTEINSAKWVARHVGHSATGSPTICIYDVVTRTAPIFCLFQNDECGTLVFPLEPSKHGEKRKHGEKPIFMTGAEPIRKVESLDLTITLEGEQLQCLRQIDEWCKKQALDNCKDWFGRNCSSTDIDVMYCSPMKVDEQGRYAPTVRAKMNLGGLVNFLTRVTFVHANGHPEEGAGWEFVQSRLGEQKWRQHRARMVLEARRIWIVGRDLFGLTYSITDVAVRQNVSVEIMRT